MALNLLLIAPTCDGQDVGEAWVAYQWVRRLAERHRVTLLTYYKRGASPTSTQLSGLRIIEWPEPPLLGQAERLNSMLKPGYLYFYWRARKWIRQALARGERFDLAHQPLPVAMRYPSPLVGFSIPYIVGPVGGSLDSPAAFRQQERATAWYVRLRRLDRLRLRFDPWLRMTFDRASCVIGIAPYVRDVLSERSLHCFEIMSETGLEKLPHPIDRSTRRGPVKLLFVGRLIRTKGARDVIEAMSKLHHLELVLDIVGDGPDRAACEQLARRLHLTDRVFFHGRKTRDAVDGFYGRADIFVFPSYREPGGNVIFEAMGYGLPLIVCDRGGPGAATDDSCAIRLHAVSPEQYAHDIASAIRRLASDRNLRLSLGEQARNRVSKIGLWDRKLDQLDAIYNSVLRQRLGAQR
ncbi:glycosyltransferase family 4 protein [Bradyrhizobium sp. CCBAU 11357]|uniref:glycosyltransferase family 4 protein n=1 Tax=Bradyrhizobium sp. CCBAU 11357 TaxID=1630808 RepID=UPI002304CF39|nr:glycosyltransferase family 4 protein [Bradyrhizobium sp. CCBAU 11357]MDA9503258.1 glycosyltransferase [Bradyrhizobium sp. CCBAU 11357]